MEKRKLSAKVYLLIHRDSSKITVELVCVEAAGMGEMWSLFMISRIGVGFGMRWIIKLVRFLYMRLVRVSIVFWRRLFLFLKSFSILKVFVVGNYVCEKLL
ncbi:MAG: hypothetical protein FWC14_08140, partial [Candidatus Bathyarchaeota archaeon]|uniref:hypothetical protein n=1 Tax=Candidatus Bathycorpusculum sp. TaxID=2994959 RepID=UPI00281ABAAC|nr:hypothetical protein [Candidatus Termiticorpusculum sp.]